MHRDMRIEPSKRKRRKNMPISIPKIAGIHEKLPSGLSYPVNLMVASPESRRKSTFVHPHVRMDSSTEWCFIEIDKDVSISSPAFCFFQMSGELSLIKLIELGYELCGSYTSPVIKRNDLCDKINARFPVSGGDNRSTKIAQNDLYGLPQLTNIKELKAFTSRMKGENQYNWVSRALRYIVDGSASPMETILVMLLILPYKYGGYGLPAPELNKRINTRKEATYRPGKVYYICDLFWPKANLAVEYDSDAYHTGTYHIVKDSKRRLELTMLGIDVITVTGNQVRDIPSFERIAKLIAQRLHKRLQYDNSKFLKAQHNLRDILLNSEKYEG